ncbi:MAG: DctP family TRAP transporter solute-binding subunit [Rhodospirillales bacterium]
MPSMGRRGSTAAPPWVLARLLVLALVLTAAVGWGGRASAQDRPIVIRFSHVVDERTPKGIGAELFKQSAEARLPGRVVVEVYPQARRYTDEEVLTAMALGDVELAAPSFTQFRGFNRAMQVFELPFLFENVDHLHRFQDSIIGRQLLDFMLPQGIMGLAYWDNGMRTISANKPLLVPADAEGLLFRTEPSAVFQAQYQRIGVSVLPLPFRAVPDAIREGLIEGQENSWSNIYSRGIHTLHKVFTELDHSFLGYMVVTNSDFWTALPADVRTTLEAVLAEVTAEVNTIAREQAETDRQKAMDEGRVEILKPTPAQLDEWREAFTAVWPDFEPQIGKEIIDAAIAARK